jgi:hypothetical protein
MMMLIMANVAAPEEQQQPQPQPPLPLQVPAAARAAEEDEVNISSSNSDNNINNSSTRLKGSGVLIRFMEKGDGVTHPQTGDSCVVSSRPCASFLYVWVSL